MKPHYPQPPCILTPEIIRRLNSDIETYERDPERWERKEREREEEREQERQQEQEEIKKQTP